MNELETRLSSMEARLRLLEDRSEIFQLMATFGPAIDSCSAEVVASLWTSDGVYETDGRPFVGNQAVASITQLEEHKKVVRTGAAHVISMPHLVIEGDKAVATGYSQLFVNKGDHHEVMRVSSNRWEFARTTTGWKVVYRINKRLAGGEEALTVLARGVAHA